jgi:hypothetical protein
VGTAVLVAGGVRDDSHILRFRSTRVTIGSRLQTFRVSPNLQRCLNTIHLCVATRLMRNDDALAELQITLADARSPAFQYLSVEPALNTTRSRSTARIMRDSPGRHAFARYPH